MSDNNAQSKPDWKGIFPEQVATKLVDIIASEKPSGWGPRSNSPYFKEAYGRAIKTEIDKMIALRRDKGEYQSIIYRYAIFCDPKTGVSRQTLYNKINQSIRYLCERMDQDGIYKKWYEEVHIERDSKIEGVVISWISCVQHPEEVVNLKPEFIQPSTDMPKWRRQIDEYLESDRQSPLSIDKLALSKDQVIQLKSELAGVSNIMVSISQSSIKIIKV